MSVEREPEVFEDMIDLSFEGIHVIIDSIFLSIDFRFEGFNIALLELEKLGESGGVHLHF